MGQGMDSTNIYGASDIILIDNSGLHPSTTTTHTVIRSGLMNLSLHGLGQGVGTKSLFRGYYCSQLKCESVGFYYSGGRAIEAVEMWDCTFEKCKFEVCGATDASYPAVHLMAGNGATAGFGHSNDLTNNIYFDKCIWEWCPSSIWSQGDNHPNELIRFHDCKFETAIATGDVIRFDWSLYGSITDSYFQLDGLGGSAKINGVNIKNGSYGTNIKNLLIRTSSSNATIANGIVISGSDNVALRDILCETGAATKPATALVTYIGTNKDHLRSNVNYATWNNAGWSPTIYSGTPTTTIT